MDETTEQPEPERESMDDIEALADAFAVPMPEGYVLATIEVFRTSASAYEGRIIVRPEADLSTDPLYRGFAEDATPAGALVGAFRALRESIPAE